MSADRRSGIGGIARSLAAALAFLAAGAASPSASVLPAAGSGNTLSPSRIGLDFDFAYAGHLLRGFDLQPAHALRYRGLAELDARLDLNVLAGWRGGSLFLALQNDHGRNVVMSPGGVEEFISSIQASDFTQLSELGLAQELLGRRIELRLGKQDAGALFNVNETGALFIFPSYTLNPTIPMPTFPAPAPGVTLRLGREASEGDPPDDPRGGPWEAGAGVYAGRSRVGRLGFDRLFKKGEESFAIGEIGWRPGCRAGEACAGSYKAGLWYHSGRFARLTPADSEETICGNYGFYLMLERSLRRGGRRSGRIDGFLQFGWAPRDRNRFHRYAAAGLLWQGPLPGRADDALGLAISDTGIVAAIPPAGSVAALDLELFYAARLVPGVSLKPDLQLFSHPRPGRDVGAAAGLCLEVAL